MFNLNVILDLLAYEGTATNDPEDADKIKSSINESTLASFSRQKIQLPDAVNDQNVPLPDPSSSYLFIFTDRNVSIKLDGSSTAIALQTRANGKKTFAFFVKGPVTGLLVTNASGGTANLDILVAKK